MQVRSQAQPKVFQSADAAVDMAESSELESVE